MPLSKNRPIMTVRHVQTAPSTAWLIEHNQHGYPLVDVYMDIDGAVQKIIPHGIEYVNDRTVRVMFTTPRTGFATVII